MCVFGYMCVCQDIGAPVHQGIPQEPIMTDQRGELRGWGGLCCTKSERVLIFQTLMILSYRSTQSRDCLEKVRVKHLKLSLLGVRTDLYNISQRSFVTYLVHKIAAQMWTFSSPKYHLTECWLMLSTQIIQCFFYSAANGALRLESSCFFLKSFHNY